MSELQPRQLPAALKGATITWAEVMEENHTVYTVLHIQSNRGLYRLYANDPTLYRTDDD